MSSISRNKEKESELINESMGCELSHSTISELSHTASQPHPTEKTNQPNPTEKNG